MVEAKWAGGCKALVRPVLSSWEHLLDGRNIAGEFVRDDRLGLSWLSLYQTPQEQFGCLLVAP